MGGRKINWPKLAQDHGYTDPFLMVQEIHRALKSKEKTALKLGVSSYSIYKMLKAKKYQSHKKCRHCPEMFEIDPKKYRQSVCSDPECEKKEIARKKELKNALAAKYIKAREDKKNDANEKYSNTPCPDCGEKMEKENRIRCNECWRRTPVGGMDESPHSLRYC